MSRFSIIFNNIEHVLSSDFLLPAFSKHQYNFILAIQHFTLNTIPLTVCSYHVTYAFQSESTLYSCLNVKELLAWSRRVIWSLSDWNWLSVRLRTKWFWVRVQFESLIVFIFVFPKLFRSFSFSNKCCVSYLAKPQWYFQKIRANNYIKLEPCHLCSNPMKTFETPFFQIVDFSTRTWFI